MKKETEIYIKGKKTRYIVTSTGGHIFRINKTNGVRKELKHFIDRDGYHRVTLHVNGKEYNRLVSRLVAIAFIDNPYDKPEVNHIDGDKDNNDVSNLEWMTTKENIDHAYANGLVTIKKGERHPNSIYKEKDIRKICKLLVKNKLSMREISIKVGIPYTIVKQIRHGIIWTELSSGYDFKNYNVSDKIIYTKLDIIKVCKLLSKEEYSIKDISKITGINYAVVYSIYNRKNWRNISDSYIFYIRSRSS